MSIINYFKQLILDIKLLLLLIAYCFKSSYFCKKLNLFVCDLLHKLCCNLLSYNTVFRRLLNRWQSNQ